MHIIADTRNMPISWSFSIEKDLYVFPITFGMNVSHFSSLPLRNIFVKALRCSLEEVRYQKSTLFKKKPRKCYRNNRAVLASSLKLSPHQVSTAKKIIRFQFNMHFPRFALLPNKCYVEPLVGFHWISVDELYLLKETRETLAILAFSNLMKTTTMDLLKDIQTNKLAFIFMAQILMPVKVTVYILGRTKRNQFYLVLDVIWN